MKKLISLLLCAVMLVSAAGVSASALTGNDSSPNIVGDGGIHLGDANADGKIDAKDAVAVKLYNVGAGELDEQNSDVFNDGKITAKDLLAIKRHLAAKEDISAFENDNNVDLFTIAGNDISEYTIVYAEDAKYVENMYYAADTLRKFIRLATGTNLTIETESTAAHKIEFVDVTTVPGMEEELYIEEYIYEVKDGDLYIYGTRRGSLYTVYEILEKYLGYRFYDDSYVYEIESRFSDIPEGTYMHRTPAVSFRYCGQIFREAKLHRFPNRLNGSQISGYSEEYLGTLTGPHFINAHSYGYYWRMATGQVDVVYTVDNKNDYKAKYDAGVQHDEAHWNPCFTSDEVYETLFRGLLETMRYCSGWQTFRPETSAMSFSICDNRYVCSCNECQFVMKDGYSGRDENKVERLNAGETGLNINLANRAARDIVKYYEGRAASTYAEGYDSMDELAGYGAPIYDEYPDMKIYTIFYDHKAPNENILTDPRYKALVPAENLIIMWCADPCNNHVAGSGECGDQVNILNQSGKEADESLKAWGDVTKVTGSQIWIWYYGVNYNTCLTDSPNVFNVYYDFVYFVEECNVNGFYYEGGGGGYLFEPVKAHMATLLMWDFRYNENGELEYMSFEEFCDHIKFYLELNFGDGYEEVFRYLEMLEAAADAGGVCYVNNCDYPGDMYGYEYIRDNYEEMRMILELALHKADTSSERTKVERLIMNCDALGLSACYKSYYVEGTDEERELYCERYRDLYNYIKNNGIRTFSGNSFDFSSNPLDYDKPPFEFFYGGGTWRSELNDQWVWTGSVPSWGYAK